MFDGLFALALQDANAQSVQTVKYNGHTLACPPTGGGGCFQAGKSWDFAWTRDVAYSIDLGLAELDPVRSANTLMIKASTHAFPAWQAGTSREIVQDTGTGGSWPISTDRVAWARGAWETLKYLDGSARTDFLNSAYTTISNTVESDRKAIYDPSDGLYRGETTFMDWREQTYPQWAGTYADVTYIAMSKTMGTNANHWAILNIASQMAAELGNTSDATKYAGWADSLKTAINKELWLDDAGMYSVMKPNDFDPAPIHRYELLGQALAISDGIASTTQSASILNNYPHTYAGAPVEWPQMTGLRPYHNKGIWPFVSSYLIRAATGRNSVVVNQNFLTLMRGAALNLSNMENFEFLSLGTNTAIDSAQQLWSIGGYLGTVFDTVFGRQATQTGIRFLPAVTKQMRNQMFWNGSQMRLDNMRYKGKTISVTVYLPPVDTDLNGFYAVKGVKLNGKDYPTDHYFSTSELADTNVIEVSLANAAAKGPDLMFINRDYYDPAQPNMLTTNPQFDAGDSIGLSWDRNGEVGTTVNVYRNGVLLAHDLTGDSFSDTTARQDKTQQYCYTIEQKYTGRKVNNVSQRTQPVCYVPQGSTVTINVSDTAFTTNDGSKPNMNYGRMSLSDWGAPGQAITASFKAASDGKYSIRVNYGNKYSDITSGTTATVKRISVKDTATDSVVAQGIVVMPGRTSWNDWGESTLLNAKLKKDGNYSITISDYYNMSYLTLNTDAGYQSINKANISGITLQRVSSAQ
ncbi:hypothetical protein NUV25_25485 [Burkholderia pseudomultivorans]|uniref:alpha-L-rhamnosidase-related protein n=1 Tax=Burkholderia pseudomultivorans TaxID=1207504 RepID=UPI002874C16A|nr:hypothetical protein [Burkholderia pseudomultivorans]MDS0861068.1 hypothetical protein [Burkholderia pseudomultivorans]